MGWIENESGGIVGEQLGLVAVRRVSAFWDHEQAGFRQAPSDRADLLERAVLVVFALHREHRAADGRDLGFDVPVAKRAREPHVVQLAESHE